MPDPIENTADMLARVRSAVGLAIAGQRGAIDDVLIALVAGGHTLLDGPPGSGRSTIVRAFASALGLKFARITMTPDLLPHEMTGTRAFHVDERGRKHDELLKGPLLSQMVLVDAIECGAPKTLAALFGAMQDRELVVAGERRSVDEAFAVFATSAPSGSASPTTPLTDAQRDRFLFRVAVPAPDAAAMVAVLSRGAGPESQTPAAVASATALLAARAVCRTITIRPRLLEWVADTLRALDPREPDAHPRARETLQSGPGVRGGQAIALAAKAASLLRGAVDAVYEDIDRVMRPALRHRVVLTREAVLAGLTPDGILDDILPPPEHEHPSGPPPRHSAQPPPIPPTPPIAAGKNGG